VAFENRPLLRPFEGLASFVSVPRYGTIDPTPFLAITLPVFVGLMVGDVGYGVVLLARTVPSPTPQATAPASLLAPPTAQADSVGTSQQPSTATPTAVPSPTPTPTPLAAVPTPAPGEQIEPAPLSNAEGEGSLPGQPLLAQVWSAIQGLLSVIQQWLGSLFVWAR